MSIVWAPPGSALSVADPVGSYVYAPVPLIVTTAPSSLVPVSEVVPLSWVTVSRSVVSMSVSLPSTLAGDWQHGVR